MKKEPSNKVHYAFSLVGLSPPRIASFSNTSNSMTTKKHYVLQKNKYFNFMEKAVAAFGFKLDFQLKKIHLGCLLLFQSSVNLGKSSNNPM